MWWPMALMITPLVVGAATTKPVAEDVVPSPQLITARYSGCGPAPEPPFGSWSKNRPITWGPVSTPVTALMVTARSSADRGASLTMIDVLFAVVAEPSTSAIDTPTGYGVRVPLVVS